MTYVYGCRMASCEHLDHEFKQCLLEEITIDNSGECENYEYTHSDSKEDSR